MKKTIYTFALLLLVGCSSNNCPKNINILPLYGRVQKCQEQIEIDKQFVQECDILFDSRALAVEHHLNEAWGFYYSNEFDNAIKRFNQAWLLDSLNADTYWGFGNILGQRQEFEESANYLEKSIYLNPNNPNVWLSASTSYAQLFYKTKNEDLLNKTIKYLKRSISIDSSNAMAYGQLTSAYSYFIQKDSARKYLEITDRLDPEQINPEVREMLMSH
jgi:tetratricopeptide (TPR) repeat protein